MAVPVVIKSGRKYMTLVLDSDMEFVALVQEIIAKFKANEKFFGTDPIALCFEGRKLSDREKLQIMDAINEFTSINASVLVEDDRLREFAANEALMKKLYPEEYKSLSDDYPECTFIRRDVEPGEKIVSEKTIVVCGTVRRGSIVTSHRDVIVLGALLGQAFAGSEGDLSATISATVFAPENFRIGELLGELPKKNQKLIQSYSRKGHKCAPEIAFAQEGEITIEPLLLHI